MCRDACTCPCEVTFYVFFWWYLTFRNFSIVDAIMNKLDNYANDLEKKIMQRTRELDDERMKGELLLYSMTPPWVYSTSHADSQMIVSCCCWNVHRLRNVLNRSVTMTVVTSTNTWAQPDTKSNPNPYPNPNPTTKGATENARPDIARPSKLWGLTSRDWTTRHHTARVNIARLVSVFE